METIEAVSLGIDTAWDIRQSVGVCADTRLWPQKWMNRPKRSDGRTSVSSGSKT